MSDSSSASNTHGGLNVAGNATAGRDMVGGNIIYNIGTKGPPPNPPTTDDATREPGAPHIWNVPHNRNPNLVGRTVELEQIRSSFGVGDLATLAERAHVPQPPGWAPLGRKHIIALTQSITGLGGIGKTSLAVEYCYKYQDAYDIVWWLRAEDSSTLAADYAALAPKLNSELARVADVPALVEWVRDYLRQHGRWLLVFDNANHPDEIRPYLPLVGKGHILITSRDPNWDEIGVSVAISTLPRTDSIQLLTEHSGDTNRLASDALADVLGDLPLALEHARAYVKQNLISLAAYLDLFTMRHAELWKNTAKPQNYPGTVATTWDLSFQQVTLQSLAAADLLTLCAFFAPDDIPLDVIVAGKEFLVEPLANTVVEPLGLNAAIATLRRYSLVERKNDNLFVHRLVQTVTRDRLRDEARKLWAEAAAKIVNDAFPSGDIASNVESWATCARLLQHGLAAVALAETENIALEQAARILNQMGLYMLGRAQFSDAKNLIERALVICEEQFGSDHPDVASAVGNLGSVLKDQGDLSGAKTHYERALAIDEKQFGPEHPNVARDVNNLGIVLRALGDLSDAQAYFERALAIDEKQFGPDHPEVARDVNNLGTVLQDLGNLWGAKWYLERALVIDEKQFGPDHPNVARDINNLGMIQHALGDLLGAKAHFERALAIDEKRFGPDHPDVAIDVNNLGSVLQDLGDPASAKTYLERALAIAEKQYGPDHPTVAICLNNLGSVLHALGDPAGAKAYLERAYRVMRAALGDEHPSTRKVKANLDSL